MNLPKLTHHQEQCTTIKEGIIDGFRMVNYKIDKCAECNQHWFVQYDENNSYDLDAKDENRLIVETEADELIQSREDENCWMVVSNSFVVDPIPEDKLERLLAANTGLEITEILYN